MLKKAKRSIAVLLAILMSLSLLSGIVLAEGNAEEPIETPIEEVTVEAEQYGGTESATDPYAAAKGALTGDVYTLATDAVIIDESYAGEVTDGSTFTYTYGGSGWGDGAKYSVTVGTNFFTAQSEVQTKLSASDYSGVRTVLLTPDTYTLAPANDKLSGTTEKVFTFLGPQAGKTPVNNPKKGYTGNAPWTIANNRSQSVTTEAVFTGVVKQESSATRYVYDGVAFKEVYFDNPHNTNTYWSIIELKNVHWVPRKTSNMFNTRNGSGLSATKMARGIYLTDCYIDATASTNYQTPSTICTYKFIMDGCYFKCNPNAAIDATDSMWNYYPSFYIKSNTAHRYGDGKDEFKIVNSRVENNPTRGLMTGMNSAPSATGNGHGDRPAGSIVYTFENNEFIDAAGYAGAVAILRPKQSQPDADIIVFKNNLCKSTKGVKTNSHFIDVHSSLASGKVLSVDATIENNIFIGYAKIAGYNSGTYNTKKAWVLNNNFFGNLDGTLMMPTQSNHKPITGGYIDQDLTVHSSELEVFVANDLYNETVNVYADFTIDATLPIGGEMTVESFSAEDGVTLGLYSDEACTTPLASLAGTGAVKTSYLKATKEGVSVVYTVTTVPDLEAYAGEKVFFDPSVAEEEEGTEVIRIINGEAYLLTVGTNIVSTITDEAYPEIDGTTHIWFLAGQYKNFKTASGSYYYHGVKEGINANDPADITKPNASRVSDDEETILYDGDYTVTSTDGPVTFDGFTFIGNAKIGIGTGTAAKATQTIELDVTNCRNSQKEDAYSSAPGTAFLHGWGYEIKAVNVTNNRFVGQCYSGTSATGFSVIRSWNGTASGNYIDCYDSVSIGNDGIEKEIFWLAGEISNGVSTQSKVDVTIEDNYLVGRISTNIQPYHYSDYQVIVRNNTLVAGEQNKSMINVNVSGSYFGSAKIDISGNTVRNTHNLTGIGFIWLTGTTNDAGMANFDSENFTITGNNIDFGSDYAYIFGADSRKDDKLIVDASGNTVANVAIASGSRKALFNNENGAYHFDMGSGSKATVVNGTAVDKAPTDGAYDLPASSIDSENKEIIVVVTDDVSTYTVSATNNTTVAVLNDEGEVVALDGTFELSKGINQAKVALSSITGVYDEVYTIKVIKGFVTVALDADKTVAAQTENASTWNTYWEANLDMVAAASTIIAGNEFKIVDYGMYYANDAEEMAKLMADASYVTAKARKESYAANENGLNVVYRNYSFRFNGISANRYRYGTFYVTYELNGTTVTSVSSMKELYTGNIS